MGDCCGCKIDKDRLPVHIAIIMDGNRRWARKKGVGVTEGHKEGAKVFEKIAFDAFDLGIKYLSVYTFSTENWTRSKEEINTIQSLLLQYIKRARDKFSDKNIRLRFVGDVERFNERLKKEIGSIERDTAQNDGMTIVLCVNYGSKDEIVSAAKKIAEAVKAGQLTADDINEKIFSSFLYTRDIPDPDLVLRPGAEIRLSNFLLWQSAYSELWFGDILWPDFTRDDLVAAICDYQRRDRRYGGF